VKLKQIKVIYFTPNVVQQDKSLAPCIGRIASSSKLGMPLVRQETPRFGAEFDDNVESRYSSKSESQV
jgi:hypothetical protein